MSPTGNTQYAAKCQQGACVSEESSQIAWVQDGPSIAPSKPVVYLNDQADNITIKKGESVRVTATCAQGSVVWTQGTDGNGSNLAPTGDTYYAAKCQSGNQLSEEGGRIVRVTDNVIVTPSQPTETLTYTGQWLLCNGTSSTPRSFAGCNGGTVKVLKDDQEYGNSNLEVAQRYAALCYKGNEIVARTTFSISAANSPSGLSIVTESTGGSVRLSASASGANSYQWNTGETGSSITVTPQSETTYSVTAFSDYNQNGCSSSASKRVSVSAAYPAPNTPGISVSRTTICTNRGESAVLTVNNCNGSLSWSTGEIASSITVYESRNYTASCSNPGYNAVSSTVNIRSAAPSVDRFDRNGTILTAYYSGCTTNISWYRWGDGYFETKVKEGDSIDISYYGQGQYEARCSNSCGEASKRDAFQLSR